MRLQSAIFDMDGTLLDSMFIWNDLGTSMMRSLGYEVDDTLLDTLKTMTVRQACEYCHKVYHTKETPRQLEDMIHNRVEDFYHNHVELKPGVREFLSLLKMEGVWMYVATATERPLAMAALRRTGIDSYFRGILTCSEVGQGKESPEIYERAMRRLQSNKRDTVVFEDALHAVRTAKAAGFRVAGVYDDFAKADQEEIKQLADYYITSYTELFHTDSLT